VSCKRRMSDFQVNGRWFSLLKYFFLFLLLILLAVFASTYFVKGVKLAHQLRLLMWSYSPDRFASLNRMISLLYLVCQLAELFSELSWAFDTISTRKLTWFNQFLLALTILLFRFLWLYLLHTLKQVLSYLLLIWIFWGLLAITLVFLSTLNVL
jgi:hypothetical protein